MENFITLLFVILFTLAVTVVSVGSGKNSISKKCQELGHFEHKEVIYECKPVVDFNKIKKEVMVKK